MTLEIIAAAPTSTRYITWTNIQSWGNDALYRGNACWRQRNGRVGYWPGNYELFYHKINDAGDVRVYLTYSLHSGVIKVLRNVVVSAHQSVDVYIQEAQLAALEHLNTLSLYKG